MSPKSRSASSSAYSDAQSESSSLSSTKSTTASINSWSSSRSLVYSRDELLTIGTSPLSHPMTAPSALASFPEIMRRTRNGPVELQQAHDDSRSTNPQQRRRRRRNSPKRDTTNQTQNVSNANSETVTPPVLKTGIYILPARRIALEQQQQQPQTRHVPGRMSRQAKSWWRSSLVRPIVI